MSCVHTHPDRVTHTQTHSRAAGSDIKHTHAPTPLHTHIYSEPTDGGEARSSVQLKLTHKPGTDRPTTATTPRKTHTYTAGQLPVRFSRGRYTGLTRAHTRASIHSLE